MQLAPNRNMDFITAYTSIVTLDQRQRYKADFNKSYAHYRKLHNVLDEVSRRFTHLESKLKQATRSSEESKIVKARIMEEYEKNKKNQEYQEARSNFQYLHEKLAHIKKLVHDYDTTGLAAR
jgi:RNA polymerase II elongation factor ELL